MKNWQASISWFLFSGFSSFAIGGIYLLFFIVPIEQWFFNEGLSQRGIDIVMNSFIILYAVSMLVMSIFYYVVVIKKDWKKTRYSTLAISFVVASYVLFLFLNPTQAAIQQLQGEVEEVDRFVFGPYPDEDKLKQLRDEGYTGVITLLSPTIPFEKVLLDKELSNGEAVGLPIYSFPMLPWVSDNKKALTGITQLINSNNGKFYVHCYLGKHRVDLAQTTIFAALGNENEKFYSHPDAIERGPIYTFNKNRLVLGAFPTDEEWFHIVLRPGTKEIISTLDPANPENKQWINKASSIAQDHGMIFTELPVISAEDKVNLEKLYQHVTALDHRTYVFDFRGGEVIKSLESKLRGIEPFVNVLVPDKFERGELIKIGRWLTVGPYPTPSEFDRLKKTGFTHIISLLNDDKEADVKWINEEKAWASANGVTYKQFALNEEKVDIEQLYEIVAYIEKEATGPVYIHGFKLGTRAQMLAQVAQGYFYGAEEVVTNKKFIDPFRPMNGAYLAKRNVIVGPIASKREWETISNLGVRHIIVVHVDGFTSDEQTNSLEQMITRLPITIHYVPLSELYMDDVINISQQHEGLIYIMTASELAEGIAQQFKDRILY
jgi:protein tyrosine phosphatase (PTP) superfamily phosphohydrolase (DUF442 family)